MLATYTWMKQGSNAVLISFASDAGNAKISQLQRISGSTSSGLFKALSLHVDGGHADSSYSLVAGALTP
jgi:hypothetical protein